MLPVFALISSPFFETGEKTVIDTERLNSLLKLEKEMIRQRQLAVKTLVAVDLSQNFSLPTEDDEKDDLGLEDLSATQFFEVNSF